MKVNSFIINLESDYSRRIAMKRRIQNTPFENAQFFGGISGKILPEDIRENMFDIRKFREIFGSNASAGEIGCALSHFELWKKISELDGYFYILEDDIHLGDNWEFIIDYVDRRLISSLPRIVLLTHRFEYYNRSKIDINGVVSVRPHNAWGTICYAINSSAARCLVNLGRPHYVADSWDYFISKGIDIRALLNHPVKVDFDFKSNIDGRASDFAKRVDAIDHVPLPITDVFVPKMLYDSLLIKFGIKAVREQLG